MLQRSGNGAMDVLDNNELRELELYKRTKSITYEIRDDTVSDNFYHFIKDFSDTDKMGLGAYRYKLPPSEGFYVTILGYEEQLVELKKEMKKADWNPEEYDLSADVDDQLILIRVRRAVESVLKGEEELKVANHYGYDEKTRIEGGKIVHG